MQIERKKVADQVLGFLIEMIQSGELPPNTQLPTENDLAKYFGVSRAPIREALKVLEVTGAIETRQGGRSWVREIRFSDMLYPLRFKMITRNQVLELLEFRMIVEVDAAALAAERRTEEELIELKHMLANFKKQMEDQEAIGFEEDFAFHQVIMKASKNSFIMKTVTNLSNLLLQALEFSLSKNLGWEKKRKEVMKEHEAIVSAVEQQDAAAAKNAMYQHLLKVRNKILEL